MIFHPFIRYSSSIVTVADADRSPEDLQRWRTALPLFGYDPVQDDSIRISTTGDIIKLYFYTEVHYEY